MDMIERYVDDPALLERARLRYMNALPTARQWLKKVHPQLRLEKTWSGKHRLSRYCEIMGIHVPKKYDQDVAAKGIRATRDAIAKYGSYAKIPADRRGERSLEGRPRPQPARLQERPRSGDPRSGGVRGGLADERQEPVVCQQDAQLLREPGAGAHAALALQRHEEEAVPEPPAVGIQFRGRLWATPRASRRSAAACTAGRALRGCAAQGIRGSARRRAAERGSRASRGGRRQAQAALVRP